MTLLDGTIQPVIYPEAGFMCLVCGEAYRTNFAGYCDESSTCAADNGENMVPIPKG
jgi:hypothetical protein